MMQQLWSKLTDHLDPFLFAMVTAIAALGLLVLFSAANETMGRVISLVERRARICVVPSCAAMTTPGSSGENEATNESSTDQLTSLVTSFEEPSG